MNDDADDLVITMLADREAELCERIRELEADIRSCAEISREAPSVIVRLTRSNERLRTCLRVALEQRFDNDEAA